MGRLSEYAIGITELRDIFRAEPGFAAQLRELAARRFPAPPNESTKRTRLLGRIGPAMKKSIERPEVPERPAPPDVEALLKARAIAPERQVYAWQIILAWLDELSWGCIDVEVDGRDMSDLDFALAAAGLPSQFGLEKLLQDEPQIPLRPMPGQRWGYAKHAHLLATRQALDEIAPNLDDKTAASVKPFRDFLAGFDDWTQQAAEQARPAPDLVVSWMP